MMKPFVVVLVAAALGRVRALRLPPTAPVTREPKGQSAKYIYELRERARSARGIGSSRTIPSLRAHSRQRRRRHFVVATDLREPLQPGSQWLLRRGLPDDVFQYGAQPDPKDNVV
jgi:hypothetical protein